MKKPILFLVRCPSCYKEWLEGERVMSGSVFGYSCGRIFYTGDVRNKVPEGALVVMSNGLPNIDRRGGFEFGVADD